MEQGLRLTRDSSRRLRRIKLHFPLVYSLYIQGSILTGSEQRNGPIQKSSKRAILHETEGGNFISDSKAPALSLSRPLKRRGKGWII